MIEDKDKPMLFTDAAVVACIDHGIDPENVLTALDSPHFKQPSQTQQQRTEHYLKVDGALMKAITANANQEYNLVLAVFELDIERGINRLWATLHNSV